MEGGTLVTENEEKPEDSLLNVFFASVSTEETSPQDSLTQETWVKQYWSEDFPLVKEERGRDHLGELDIHESICPDRMHLRVLRELADTIARLLTMEESKCQPLGSIRERMRTQGTPSQSASP
ncbi:hypothetical protein DUI87_18866 [Hirundo rustica rustica]|uniref:Uncharacterized protein n=1 Tax=Hirundo rustica rustica TaxID=333673 RepID=A0A3M0JZ44_HIRRU|nr:hypothetical protein DUI87_18866 [Hirundo rustica rustica]